MMKKIVLSLLFSLGCISIAHAQGTPATKSGNAGILFSINGFGDFGVGGTLVGTTPAGGLADSIGQVFGQRFVSPVYGVGMIFYVGDNLGFRIGLGFNSSSNARPVNDSVENQDSRLAFGISPALQVHLVNAGPVSFYTGGALSFATSTTSSTPRGVDSLETSESRTGIGIGAIVGAEFYPWTNFSLGAEYQLGLTLSSASSKARGETTDGPSSTDIGISGPIRITLGMHF